MKKKYVPDLVKAGTLCTHNYFRLLAILGQQDSSEYYFALDGQTSIQLKLLSQAPFTRTILIRQTHTNSLINFEIKVCLYDDVKLAEVISYQQQRCTLGNNPYPNKHMHHIDEKLQANLFLQDCLLQCLKQGHTHNLLPKCIDA